MKFRLNIDFDGVNYAQIIRALLPYVNKADIPLPEAVVNAAGSPGVLENFLRFIPAEEQDRIVLSIFEKNKDRLASGAVKLADRNGVDVNIQNLTLTKLN
jgi:hypothetical protein